jgi:predicted DNA-binding transcriptional regulator YafY
MQTRKNLPKTALPRIYRIDEMIAGGTFPSTRQMAKVYETSVSSISRDIDFMKNSLGAPIEYSALHRGCTAKPLEPEKLVKHWKLHIDKMKKLAEV